MVKSLTKHGNSLALLIDKPILDLLKIDADTKLEVRTNGKDLILSPIRDQLEDAEFEAALRSVNDQFGEVLRNLAK
jgi:antitoxin component of MazEF toxin-antitoxin module